MDRRIGNSSSLAWRTSGEPTSYTAELSEDSTFAASATLSQTVEGGKCTFDNLKYETAYYVRVRANNEAMQLVSNWTVYESTVSTLSRIVPKLLYPVDERNITDGSVLLQWTGADETNPVDGLCVWTEEEMETDLFHYIRSHLSDYYGEGEREHLASNLEIVGFRQRMDGGWDFFLQYRRPEGVSSAWRYLFTFSDGAIKPGVAVPTKELLDIGCSLTGLTFYETETWVTALPA